LQNIFASVNCSQIKEKVKSISYERPILGSMTYQFLSSY